MKFSILEKFVNLMKDQKYEHQSIFPFWGRINLILGISTENQIFFVRTPATVKFFSPNCQKMTLRHHWEGGCHGGVGHPHDGGHPSMPPVMGAVTDTPHDCKTTLNIDIYPSTSVFVGNIGHNYDFEGGWGGLW